MLPISLPEGILCACETNRWKRIPGDGGTIIVCATCGDIAAIVSEGGAEYSPGVSLHTVTLTLCSLDARRPRHPRVAEPRARGGLMTAVADAAICEALAASGWSAQVVQLPAGERAERISDYALEA